MESMNTSPEGIPLPMPTQLDSNQFGVYRGVLPCEDCGSKQVRLELFVDDTYELIEVHRDNPDKVCKHMGSLKYDEFECQIRLPMEGKDPRFEFLDDQLILLDSKGNRTVTEVSQTPFLFKIAPSLQLALWRITKVEGDSLGSDRSNQSIVEFKADGQVTYSGGCNQCMAKYKSVAEGEIYIKVGACTKMLCPGEDWDLKVSNAFRKSTNYSLNNGILIFKNSKGEALIQLESLI